MSRPTPSFPRIGIGAWGALHSIAALILVWFGRYDRFEATMKALIALMVLTLLASVVLVGPDLAQGSPRAPDSRGFPPGSATTFSASWAGSAAA